MSFPEIVQFSTIVVPMIAGLACMAVFKSVWVRLILGLSVGAVIVVTAFNTVKSDDPNGFATEFKSGSYDIYAIQKAFDGRTGEPLYWIIADRLESEGSITHMGEIRFYQIPRRLVRNLEDDGGAQNQIFANLAVDKLGVAEVRPQRSDGRIILPAGFEIDSMYAVPF